MYFKVSIYLPLPFEKKFLSLPLRILYFRVRIRLRAMNYARACSILLLVLGLMSPMANSNWLFCTLLLHIVDLNKIYQMTPLGVTSLYVTCVNLIFH